VARTRTPSIVADAAYAILSAPSSVRTGQLLIDDDVLREVGITDLAGYALVDGNTDFEPDFFLGEE
jgi:citronellol/citronellal dehydrogenase